MNSYEKPAQTHISSYRVEWSGSGNDDAAVVLATLVLRSSPNLPQVSAACECAMCDVRRLKNPFLWNLITQLCTTRHKTVYMLNWICCRFNELEFNYFPQLIHLPGHELHDCICICCCRCCCCILRRRWTCRGAWWMRWKLRKQTGTHAHWLWRSTDWGPNSTNAANELNGIAAWRWQIIVQRRPQKHDDTTVL